MDFEKGGIPLRLVMPTTRLSETLLLALLLGKDPLCYSVLSGVFQISDGVHHACFYKTETSGLA